MFSVDKEKGLKLEEIAEGVSVQQIVEATECEFDVAKPLKPMKQVPVPPGIVTAAAGSDKTKRAKTAPPAAGGKKWATECGWTQVHVLIMSGFASATLQ